MLPNVSSVRRTTSAWCSVSSAFPAIASATSAPPRPAAASSSASWLRAVMTTRAPSATSRSAMPYPMPRLAPVTIAALPSNLLLTAWAPFHRDSGTVIVQHMQPPTLVDAGQVTLAYDTFGSPDDPPWSS